jgi:RNA polymerase sigma-70 factor (ECF subfamily)
MNAFNDEQDLIRESSQGDREAFRVLVERYQSKMLRLVAQIIRSREDAEDIVQESFVKAYSSLGSFRGQSSFYTWLYRISFNLAIDWKRRAARRGGDKHELTDIEQGKVTASVPEAETPSDQMYRKEQSRLINVALAQLTEEHRAVIVLREIDGLSYEEIAKVTGSTLGTVMSRLHYARKKLQVALQEIRPDSHEVGIQIPEKNFSNEKSNVKQAVYG